MSVPNDVVNALIMSKLCDGLRSKRVAVMEWNNIESKCKLIAIEAVMSLHQDLVNHSELLVS